MSEPTSLFRFQDYPDIIKNMEILADPSLTEKKLQRIFANLTSIQPNIGQDVMMNSHSVRGVVAKANVLLTSICNHVERHIKTLSSETQRRVAEFTDPAITPLMLGQMRGLVAYYNFQRELQEWVNEGDEEEQNIRLNFLGLLNEFIDSPEEVSMKASSSDIGGRLTSLPTHCFDYYPFKRLVKLDLSEHDLDFFPDASFTSLKALSLSYNWNLREIEALPASLHTLHISFCPQFDISQINFVELPLKTLRIEEVSDNSGIRNDLRKFLEALPKLKTLTINWAPAMADLDAIPNRRNLTIEIVADLDDAVSAVLAHVKQPGYAGPKVRHVEQMSD